MNTDQKGFLQTDEFKDDPEYEFEGVLLKFNDDVCNAMSDKKINRSELGRRIGTTRAYISRMLNGTPNMTLFTMVKVACALGKELVCDLREKEPT